MVESTEINTFVDLFKRNVKHQFKQLHVHILKVSSLKF